MCNLVYGWFELEASERRLAEFGWDPNEYLPKNSFKNVNIRSQIFGDCNQILEKLTYQIIMHITKLNSYRVDAKGKNNNTHIKNTCLFQVIPSVGGMTFPK